MDKLKMHSPDLTSQNIDKIGALFPNCITETVDENGKPKSATFLYSFLLAILFGVIYAASYLLLLDVLNNAFGALPVFWQNVLHP